jgi:hypothetical protein
MRLRATFSALAIRLKANSNENAIERGTIETKVKETVLLFYFTGALVFSCFHGHGSRQGVGLRSSGAMRVIFPEAPASLHSSDKHRNEDGGGGNDQGHAEFFVNDVEMLLHYILNCR